MKKYIDAEMQFIRMNNKDIVTESLAVSSTEYNGQVYDAGRRMDDWDAGY